jgi:hypothetical protein
MLAQRISHIVGYRFAGAVITGLLVLGASAPSAAYGQTTLPPTGWTNPNSQAIAQLKSIRALLHGADHDYQGYRVKAMHQITDAIHALEGIKTPPKKPHKPPTGQKGNHEPQAVSDAQLTQAIQQLQTVQSQLTGTTGHHVAAASNHITKAIQDLQTALKIK